METAVAIGAEIEAELRRRVGRAALEGLKATLADFVDQAGGAEALAERRSRAAW
jgi:hypothetical protein